MSLAQMRREVFEEGTTFTLVRILRGAHEEEGELIIDVEFGETASLSPESSFADGGKMIRPFVVPAGAVVEVSADGVPLPEPFDTSHFGEWVHYRFGRGETGFTVPNSWHKVGGCLELVEGFNVTGTIVWSRETGNDDPEYYDEYLFKPDRATLLRLAERVRREREWSEDRHLLDKILPRVKERVCVDHGLSADSVFYTWNGDLHVGVDVEQGLVYWDRYDP